jgi:hypothetical protein
MRHRALISGISTPIKEGSSFCCIEVSEKMAVLKEAGSHQSVGKSMGILILEFATSGIVRNEFLDLSFFLLGVVVF